LLILALLCVLAQSEEAPVAKPSSAFSAYVENKGQWDEEAKFLARGSGLDLWVTRDGMVFDVYRHVAAGSSSDSGLSELLQLREEVREPQTRQVGHVVRLRFLGAGDPYAEGRGIKDGHESYFLGSDPSRWASGCRRFESARLGRLYAGIDAVFYFDGDRPRYDLIVAPGADPSQIRMSFEGADKVSLLPDGTLRLDTSVRPIQHQDLFAYQEAAGTKLRVPCRMKLERGYVTFELGHYDRTKPLVIDPLIFSTFWRTAPYKIAIDDQENVIFASYGGARFPATSGAYQQDPRVLGLTKLRYDGRALVWSTFIGGTTSIADNSVSGLRLTAGGDVILLGSTKTADFPTTSGAFRTSLAALGGQAGFACRINALGNQLMWSTFLGGSGTDIPLSLALDSEENLIIAGNTSSNDLPTTEGAFKRTRSSAREDGFVLKLNNTGTGLVWSSFLFPQRQNYDGDLGSTRAPLDKEGSLIVYGHHYLKAIPVTAGVFQNRLPAQVGMYVMKMTPDARSVTWATYIGDYTRQVRTAVVDAQNNIIIQGYSSLNHPTTSGAYDPRGRSMVLTKLHRNGTHLVWSTAIGNENRTGVAGVGAGDAVQIALDSQERVVVAGHAQQAFPTTPGAYSRVWRGRDAFDTSVWLGMLSADGSTLLHGTYVASSGPDKAIDMALDRFGQPVGVASSPWPDWPVTPGAYNTTYRHGEQHWSVFKLNMPIEPHFSILTLEPQFVTTGGALLGTVAFSHTASGPRTVSLASRDARLVVPSVVTVPAGQRRATFQIEAPSVEEQEFWVDASHGGEMRSAWIFTVKPALAQVTITPNQTIGGQLAQGRVELTGPTTAAVMVQLRSNSSVLEVPPNVQIPAGQRHATFAVTTKPVGFEALRSITATYDGRSEDGWVTLLPYIRVHSLVLNPSTVDSQSSTTATVHLTSPAQVGGATVFVHTDSSAINVPDTVVVPGGQTSTTFTVGTNRILFTATRTVFASAGGNTRAAALTILPAPQLLRIDTDKTTVKGGESFFATIRLTKPAGPGGARVFLRSNSSAIVTPEFLQFSPGQSSRTAVIQTRPVGQVFQRSFTATYFERSIDTWVTLTP
jgi:hypothetical protein